MSLDRHSTLKCAIIQKIQLVTVRNITNMLFLCLIGLLRIFLKKNFFSSPLCFSGENTWPADISRDDLHVSLLPNCHFSENLCFTGENVGLY